MKSLRIVGTFTLFVAICAVGMHPAPRPARVEAHAELPNAPVQNLKIQKLTGDAARLRAKQLRKRNKGVARAMKDAEKKGLREAFDQGVVILASDPAKAALRNSSGAGASIMRTSFAGSPQDFTDGEYEVSFFPFDDGDPNTWEGIIYRNGPDIDEDSRYAVVNIETEDFTVIQEIYYPPEGGDPCSTGDGSRCYYQSVSKSNAPTQNRTRATRGMSSSGAMSSAMKFATTAFICPQGCPSGQHRCIGHEATGCCGVIPPIDNWIKRSLWNSAGSAITCSRTGPAWGSCWAFGTAAGMFMALRSN